MVSICSLTIRSNTHAYASFTSLKPIVPAHFVGTRSFQRQDSSTSRSLHRSYYDSHLPLCLTCTHHPVTSLTRLYPHVRRESLESLAMPTTTLCCGIFDQVLYANYPRFCPEIGQNRSKPHILFLSSLISNRITLLAPQ